MPITIFMASFSSSCPKKERNFFIRSTVNLVVFSLFYRWKCCATYRIATKMNNRTGSHLANFYNRLTQRLGFVWMWQKRLAGNLAKKKCWQLVLKNIRKGSRIMTKAKCSTSYFSMPESTRGRVIHAQLTEC